MGVGVGSGVGVGVGSGVGVGVGVGVGSGVGVGVGVGVGSGVGVIDEVGGREGLREGVKDGEGIEPSKEGESLLAVGEESGPSVVVAEPFAKVGTSKRTSPKSTPRVMRIKRMVPIDSPFFCGGVFLAVFLREVVVFLVETARDLPVLEAPEEALAPPLEAVPVLLEEVVVLVPFAPLVVVPRALLEADPF